mmetsp:Transcript_49651/g.105701  ORF Transcript_49651/g.105701 Transcript_49651/m.105701 type:complete len:653 (+) Transcript_49651:110-2068(+)
MVKRSEDPSTLSEPLGPGRARVQHMDIEATVDFVGKRLLGFVDYKCLCNAEAPADGEAWEVVLDAANNLSISKVLVGESDAKWKRDEARKSSSLGLALRVELVGAAPGAEVVVRVFFETEAPNEKGEGGCSALQWLSPEQTAGKKFPYVFSQCQAIHARAMLPVQDTCECKVTYNANIKAPADLLPLMSAVKIGEGEKAEADWETPSGCSKEWSVHRFEQKVPIPPYLIAIVCANLESRRVGPRSCVWSEPSMVEDCAWEFADTEKFVAAGEKICGPYRWGVYDLLVLPPSFPYGGMENPCLTFVTPTLLAKDRSQVHVVAHEIAHSWSGNLVTNQTWEHFWLNEGLTVFVELRILRDVYGQEEATIHLADRLTSLREDVKHFTEKNLLNYTQLIPDLSSGEDPDDAFSTVPYIKGMSLFSLLEKSIGGEEYFGPFLKAYFDHFGGKTVTSYSMRDFYLSYFGNLTEDSKVQEALKGPIASFDWETLFKGPGMPAFLPEVDEGPLKEAANLAQRWIKVADDSELEQFSTEDIKGWGTQKCINLLDDVLSECETSAKKLSPKACEKMNECYGFLKSNCEVKFRFLRLALASKWSGAEAPAIEMATSQGRMKYTRPLYRSLKAYNAELAQQTFAKHKSSYHPICAKMVGSDLSS